MKNIKINKYMKNKKTLALIGIGAFLIVNDLHNHSHFNKLSDKLDKLNTCSNEYYTINEKLDHLTKHTETADWEGTIETMKETIDSLLYVEMDLGAMLDSCIISK